MLGATFVGGGLLCLALDTGAKRVATSSAGHSSRMWMISSAVMIDLFALFVMSWRASARR